jgi:hypothetical protein
MHLQGVVGSGGDGVVEIRIHVGVSLAPGNVRLDLLDNHCGNLFGPDRLQYNGHTISPCGSLV